jgi:outer membrane protein OmpA-like peptidoglycan-associated protein
MMNKVWIFLVFGLVLFLSTDVFAQADAANCKDHSLFPSRMPDYRIEACKVEDFGRYEFYAVKGPKTPAEGRFTFITYAYTGAKGAEPSGLAVVRNYENAITSVGGEVLQSDPNRWINGKITKDGLEVWAQVEKGNGKIWLRIIEKKAMEQHITADAAALGNDIRSTGHVAVYGINFDTAKSTIKPESAQAIAEIGKLLKADSGLKVFVVGHTDNVGSVDSNMKLSQERAEAVLQSLVKDHGIAADRLRAAGCGTFAPVAANDTEEGRAKNRRVELVKQ